MRYRIYCGTAPLYRNREELLLDTNDGSVSKRLEALKLVRAVNKAGLLTGTLLRGNRQYDNINLMRSTVEAWDGDVPIWSGRPIGIEIDKNGRKTIECEGNLNYLADIPDVFTNPAAMAKHYKIGSESSAETLAFTEKAGTGLYGHKWEGSEFELLYLSEIGSAFYVEYDGDKYDLFQNCLKEYQGSTPELNTVGFIGAISMYNDEYKQSSDDPGASVPFFVDNTGIYTKDTAASHTLKIYRRDSLTVQAMFALMFAGYNSYASPERYLYGGICDIDGAAIYDPEPETSCLDTLHNWQEIFGGYIYTSYDVVNGRWNVNYTKASGAIRNDVPIRYGLNITDIKIQKAGEKIVTAIYGIGVDSQDKSEINLAFSGSSPVREAAGYTLLGSIGYVSLNAAVSVYGYIRQQKIYEIPHTESNKEQYLYDLVCADLAQAQRAAETVTVSAIDARLLGVNAGRPEQGDICGVDAAPYGVDGEQYPVTEIETDFLAAGNGKMALGGVRKTLSESII